MSAPGIWPGGARGAVSVTVDNLGEAAEIQLGLRDASAPLGGHYSVTTALPIMLDALGDAQLSATFFVEGINAEAYPDALREIHDAGHEVAYHAWCHEDWSALDAEAENANLERGLTALRSIGFEARGLRPPGGRLTARTLDLLADRGMLYCSPAGSSPGLDRVAVIPFDWPAVDAFHLLPGFATLREHLGGNADPGDQDTVRAALLRSIDQSLADGGHTTLVLHTMLIELERSAVDDVLARVRKGVEDGELWVAPCREVAVWLADHAASFTDPPTLDDTSWMAPS